MQEPHGSRSRGCQLHATRHAQKATQHDVLSRQLVRSVRAPPGGAIRLRQNGHYPLPIGS